jgi:GDP-mannose 6-dehydrogenase
MAASVEEVTAFAETLVIGNGAEEFRAVLNGLRADQHIIDLVRIVDRRSQNAYDGICW